MIFIAINTKRVIQNDFVLPHIWFNNNLLKDHGLVSTCHILISGLYCFRIIFIPRSYTVQNKFSKVNPIWNLKNQVLSQYQYSIIAVIIKRMTIAVVCHIFEYFFALSAFLSTLALCQLMTYPFHTMKRVMINKINNNNMLFVFNFLE